MANVSVTAEWQLLYTRYYRKPELYPYSWEHVDLARTKVVVAPFGGLVAIIQFVKFKKRSVEETNTLREENTRLRRRVEVEEVIGKRKEKAALDDPNSAKRVVSLL
ncbi:hypothetical protein LR48_Vigan10g237700 [Vigna angularis]|uniref:Uncharacterized protein n=1 Tax=Phaseolus angularis TaxID=3914 RepID=A0A0L9VN65_PHAAN|nr:hypothetical protein LR48_Vigan10g237700 [Vigna angularis]